MAGSPGTPRFGVNPDITPDKTSANGTSHLTLPKMGNQWTETHFTYNPVQRSRDMGTTQGDAPGQMWMQETHQCNYMCNHDGYVGGTTTIMNLDERKNLHNTIYAVGCEYDSTSPNGSAPAQTEGKFD